MAQRSMKATRDSYGEALAALGAVSYTHLI